MENNTRSVIPQEAVRALGLATSFAARGRGFAATWYMVEG